MPGLAVKAADMVGSTSYATNVMSQNTHELVPSVEVRLKGRLAGSRGVPIDHCIKVKKDC